MNIAIDVYYKQNQAKCVGVIFDWNDSEPSETITGHIPLVEEYVPGHFYKRELPCLVEVLNKTNLNNINTIIVDGYVYTNNFFAYGLGGHLWEQMGRKIPVVGVAKTRFSNNELTCISVLRGASKVPLYVSAIGTGLEEAAENIKHMHGQFRLPTILKTLDAETRV
ncbi:MAG: endonuclease V [Chitinophagales bacterium]|nr:endonuclease V [Chitinophagales bacterium]